MPKEYGVTKEGFVLKRLDTILAEVNDYQKEGLGFDPSVNPQSFLSVLNTSFGDRVADLWELAMSIYFASYPSSAEGLSLDNAMQFGGISRLQKARTIYTLKCTGQDGTDILYGSMVRSTTQPVKQFQCSRLQRISRESFREIRLKVVLDNTTQVFTVAINNGTYSYQQKAGDDEAAVLLGIKNAITDPAYTATVEERTVDDVTVKELVVAAVNRQSSGTMVLSENIVVTECSSNIVFESVEYGKVIVPNGTISEIVTIIPGWETVTNDISPVSGRLTETDVEARQSYIKRIAVRSKSMVESVVAAIYDNVQGVTAVTGYENDDDEEDAAGRKPHSIEVVVDGGDDGDIAQQIYANKTNGIGTNGTIVTDIADEFGNFHTIRFNRPEYLYVWLKVTLTRNPKEAVAPNYAARTKDSIVKDGESLTVGETVLTQTFLAGIYQNVTGVGMVEIKAFATTNPSQAPTVYNLDNIEVGPRQKAVFDVSRIEVNLVGN